MINTKGLEAELLCQVELIKRDFDVSEPVNPHGRYDLIVDNGIDLLRIQTKARMLPRKRRQNDVNRYEVELRGTADNKRTYSKNEVHFFILLVSNKYVWYIIPANVVKDKKTISLYPTDSNKKYSQFMNAWHLLRDPAALDMSLANSQDKPL